MVRKKYAIVVTWDIGEQTKEDVKKAIDMYRSVYKTDSNTVELVEVE